MKEERVKIVSNILVSIFALLCMSTTVGLAYWLFDRKLFDVIPVWLLVLICEILWYTLALLRYINIRR